MNIPEWSRRGAQLAAQTAEKVVAIQSGKNHASGWLYSSTQVVSVEHILVRDSPHQVFLPDGRSLAAQTLAVDEGLDLALLVLEEEVALPEPIVGRPAESLLPGEWVMAVARSASDGLGVAAGVLSCASGPWTSCRGGQAQHFIQPDLNLYPGFSGGPLIDAQGRWIGLNTRGLSRYQPITLSLADVQDVLQRLQSGPRGTAYLGLGLHGVELSAELVGAMVVNLDPDSPAARAGMLLGDILLRIDGVDTPGTAPVLALLKQLSPGLQVEVEGVRAGTSIRWIVELAERRAT